MDAITLRKLRSVIEGYRTLGEHYHQLYLQALENHRLSQLDLFPAVLTLDLQRRQIEDAQPHWWMFYSYVDRFGERKPELEDHENQISYNRNHLMVQNLSDLLIKQLDVDLDRISVIEFELRSNRFYSLAKNLGGGLIDEGLID